MATFDWLVYANTPGWMDVGANTIVFAGSGGLDTPITVGSYQDETHLGNGDPGTDQCGTNHMNNVKYISGTQCDVNGGGTQTNTALVATEATLQIKFTDAGSVATSNARFYSFDGTTETDEAVGIEAYAFEEGAASTDWVQINDDSGNIGGDNTGERLELDDSAAETEHFFQVSISARPESVGTKTQFDLGVALTYS